ncbi:hypothetical protein EJB05_42294, partial [Eragrostis curvula]
LLSPSPRFLLCFTPAITYKYAPPNPPCSSQYKSTHKSLTPRSIKGIQNFPGFRNQEPGADPQQDVSTEGGDERRVELAVQLDIVGAPDLADAVEEFQRREAHAEDDARSATSSTPSSPAIDGEDTTDSEESSLAAEDSAFELDVFNDMSWDLYYASLAQGMLMEPPCAVTAFGDDAEANIPDMPLWSY